MTVPSGWFEWHDRYGDPRDPLAARLRHVRGHLDDALRAAAPGPIRLVSMCAGQGHDVLGVVPRHPRAPDVRALLVERDERNVAAARQTTMESGAPGVQVVAADASRASVYRDHVPAHIVVACGIFGHLERDDQLRFIAQLPALCAPGARVVWTRDPQQSDHLRAAFEAAGFLQRAFGPTDPEARYGAGVHELVGDGAPYDPDAVLFTFLSDAPGDGPRHRMGPRVDVDTSSRPAGRVGGEPRPQEAT